MSPSQVNVLALMAAAGVSEEEAYAKLESRVRITAANGSCESRLSGYVADLLRRTLQIVENGPADIELSIGCNNTHKVSFGFAAQITPTSVDVYKNSTKQVEVNSDNHPSDLFLKIAACYMTGAVITAALFSEGFESLPNPFIISASSLGISDLVINQKIEFDDFVLIGAGGVASGFVWALESLDVSGRLYICDAKTVAESNLNRCLYFGPEDVGQPKAEILAREANMGKLELIPFFGQFRELRGQLGRVRRVFTTVDSRRARRSVRNELPLEVLDASTTDISEVVVFSERQPTKSACLACIYAHIPAENQREQHIADSLGITLVEVQQNLIDDGLAHKLSQIHGLDEAHIRGMAFDSLFREMCGAGKLLSSPGKQALAPLGFISNLSGTLLALELLRFDVATGSEMVTNYMALDPWRPPHRRARMNKPARPDCQFCSNPDAKAAMKAIWTEAFA